MLSFILFAVIFTAILALSAKLTKGETLHPEYTNFYQKESRPIGAMPPSHEFYRAVPRNYF